MSGRKNSPLFIFNPAIRADLGTAPDAVIAARHGVHPLSIHKWRNHFGIPPCPAETHRRTRLADLVPAELRARLGTAPDTAVAREFGVRYQWVRRKREQFGIKAYREGVRK